MKRREWILVISAVVIAGLCWWRLSWSPQHQNQQNHLIADQRPAPAFELYDQQSRRVSLQAFLHRHPVVLVFFDGHAGPDAHRLLGRLRDVYPALERSGVKVLAVSNLLPQEIREQSSASYPFPILSDLLAGQAGSASQLYGCVDADAVAGAVAGSQADAMASGDGSHAAAVIESATFYIDRLGLVNWHAGSPMPVADPDLLVSELLAGKR